MDDLPPDLEKLFTQERADLQEISEEELQAYGSPKNVSCIRCKCGEIVYLRMPCLCPGCEDSKAYWRMLDGRVIPLSKMDLGHLSNTVRILGKKAEAYPSGDFRKEIEIAMDLIYNEIGSREQELKQATGIHNALKKSLASNV